MIIYNIHYTCFQIFDFIKVISISVYDIKIFKGYDWMGDKSVSFIEKYRIF